MCDWKGGEVDQESQRHDRNDCGVLPHVAHPQPEFLPWVGFTRWPNPLHIDAKREDGATQVKANHGSVSHPDAQRRQQSGTQQRTGNSCGVHGSARESHGIGQAMCLKRICNQGIAHHEVRGSDQP